MTKKPYADYAENNLITLNDDSNAPTPRAKISPTSANSNEITVNSKKYAFCIGIDNIEFSNINIEENMCSTPKEILPVNTTKVVNEKIFFGLRTRFSIDTEDEVIIKKNGSPVDISLDTAIELNEDGYTVSYTPLDAHNIRVTNSSIRVKAIIRTFDKNSKAPFIKSLAIKKYGRNSLWNDSTIN